MDLKYWEAYYAKRRKPGPPSKFAHFVQNHLNGCHANILELGCGDGRDAVYLSGQGHKVLAIDQCHSQIGYLEKFYSDRNIQFRVLDFTNISELGEANFGCIYSRFTLHSVDAFALQQTVERVVAALSEGGYSLVSLEEPGTSYLGWEKIRRMMRPYFSMKGIIGGLFVSAGSPSNLKN